MHSLRQRTKNSDEKMRPPTLKVLLLKHCTGLAIPERSSHSIIVMRERLQVLRHTRRYLLLRGDHGRYRAQSHLHGCGVGERRRFWLGRLMCAGADRRWRARGEWRGVAVDDGRRSARRQRQRAPHGLDGGVNRLRIVRYTIEGSLLCASAQIF